MARMMIKHDSWGEVSITIHNNDRWVVEGGISNGNDSFRNYLRGLATTPPTNRIHSFWSIDANRKMMWLMDHLERLGATVVETNFDDPVKPEGYGNMMDQ